MDMQPANMKDYAYHYIKDKILNCEYLPGQDISEKQIIEALGTGRTPVREALITLQNEGLVEVFPRRGTCAKTITVADTIQLYQLRRLIEPNYTILFKSQIDPAGLLEYDARFKGICGDIGYESDIAFYKLDIAFHSFIVDSAGNTRLSSIFGGIMQDTYRLGIFSTIQSHNNTKMKTYEEHRRIIQAIMMEDDREIEQAFVAHINRSRISSLKTLEQAGVPGE